MEKRSLQMSLSIHCLSFPTELWSCNSSQLWRLTDVFKYKLFIFILVQLFQLFWIVELVQITFSSWQDSNSIWENRGTRNSPYYWGTTTWRACPTRYPVILYYKARVTTNRRKKDKDKKKKKGKEIKIRKTKTLRSYKKKSSKI